jgi:mannose-6-phosphate isomerase-like protein (cupin superfamily)
MKKQFLPLTMLSLLLSHVASGQSNKVEYFSIKDLQTQLADLAPKAEASGSSGSTLGDYGSHALKLSVRTTSGGAEVHTHFDDVIVVTQGQATLVTGGSVIDAKTDTDGETKGSSIRDGKSQVISAGDIVHIPAGTPHQMTIAPGVLFSVFVVKVKE